jgi:hypothetical protein
MVPMSWENPFAKFLSEANAEIGTIQRLAKVGTEHSEDDRLVTILEHRNFVFDIVSRIEVLAAAFERLVSCSNCMFAQTRADYWLMQNKMAIRVNPPLSIQMRCGGSANAPIVKRKHWQHLHIMSSARFHPCSAIRSRSRRNHH